MGMRRRGVKFLEGGGLSDLLYADDLVLCSGSEKDPRPMVRRLTEVCRRRGLKVNASKSKLKVLNGEEGLEWEVCIDEMRLKRVSEFKYLGCGLNESGKDEAECRTKVVSRRKVASAINSLVHASGLQLQCGRFLHETLLVLVLMYGSETMVWKEKEKSRIRAVQMDKLRGLLGIREMDKIPNARIMK